MAGGLITGGVFFAGRGDMTIVIAPMMGIAGFVLGAVLGGISSVIGHQRKNGSDEKGDGQNAA